MNNPEANQPLLLADEWSDKNQRQARVAAALQTWDLETLLAGLRHYLQRCGVRQPEYYLWIARNFLSYLAVRDRVWPGLEAGDLEAFMEELGRQGAPLEGRRRQRGLSRASLRKALRGIKHLAEFLTWAGLEWPAHLRFPQPTPLHMERRPLREEEWQRLLRSATFHPRPVWRSFLLAVLHLMVEGVHINELIHLRLADLELAQRRLTVRGRRTRTLTFDAATAQALQVWLEEREVLAGLQPVPFPHLLLRPARWRSNTRGRPLSRPALVEALHGLFDLAEVDGTPGARLQWTAIRRALQRGEHPTQVAMRLALAYLPRLLRDEV